MNRLLVIILAFALWAGATETTAEEAVIVGGTGAALGYLNAVAKARSDPAGHFTVEVVEGLGSSAAIRAVSEGVLDLAITGRPLKPRERELGIEATPLLETPFGFFTSRRRAIRVEMTELWELYAHVGSPNPLAGGEILRPVLRPEDDSDTAFASANFPGLGDAITAARQIPAVPVAHTDQASATMAESVINGVATGTLLQMKSEKRSLFPVVIGGVTPSLDSVRSGAYPWSKRLYLVTRPDLAPSVQALVAWLLSPEAEALADSLGAMRAR